MNDLRGLIEPPEYYIERASELLEMASVIAKSDHMPVRDRANELHRLAVRLETTVVWLDAAIEAREIQA